MFTGLVEEVGTVVTITRRGAVHELIIRADVVFEDISIGDSIAIAGVCQTVTAFGGGTFTVQAVAETMERTSFSSLTHGCSVNIERALRVGDRLGGHFVQGHVEACGTVKSINVVGEGRDYNIAVPTELLRYIVEKGSITIDGISLTVTKVSGVEFGISVIPHTIATTTLRETRVGSLVNIETDMIAKYLDNLTIKPGGVTMELLSGLGFE